MTAARQVPGVGRAATTAAVVTFIIGAVGLLAGGGALVGYLVDLACLTMIAPLLMSGGAGIGQGIIGLASCLGMTAAWLVCRRAAMPDIAELAEMTAVAVAVTTAELGVTRLVCWLGVPPAAAAATAVVLSVGWMAWPLWLTTAPPLLVRVHPLLAVNGVLAGQFGAWTELPVAYRVMSLGQDAAYTLPGSPAWCVAAHFGLGLTAIALSTARWRSTGAAGGGRVASRSTNQIDPAAAADRTA